jgi:hypothetical protein
MVRRIRIILEYAIGFGVILFLISAIACVVAVKFYGDDLQKYVMEEVNERIDTKVHVESVSVRIFHRFPSISMILGDITVWSSHNFNAREFGTGADTLLSAQKISLSFNLFGIIRKKYNIRQVEISNGNLHILIDQAGEGNYMLQGKKKSSKKSSRLVDIGNLRLTNFQVLLDNHAKQLKSSGYLDQMELNGRFSGKNTQIRGNMKGFLGEISNKGILYASERQIGARLNLDVEDSVYTIEAGQLQIDRIIADMEGKLYPHRDRGIEMNLTATARNLEIHEVLDLLPGGLTRSLSGIRGSGILQVSSRVTGIASSTRTPRIEADFETSRANLFWERLPFSVKNLNLTGSYSNGGEFNPVTTTLNIESVSAVIGTDHLSGRAGIRNFYDPVFSFELKGDIHPEQWIEWYDGIPLQEADGTVVTDIRVEGSLDRLRPRGHRFLEFDITGGISLEEVSARINQDGASFEEVNGSVHIDNDFWESSFTGKFGESDFDLSGTGLNLLSALIKENETLVASASFRSGHLDLQQILDQFPREESGEVSAIRFPDHFDLRLDFVINDFVKDRFEASNVRGLAFYDAPAFFIDSLTMQAMEGTLRGSFGLVQDLKGDIYTNVKASLHNLDIRQLFYVFNDFGQNQLTYDHLEGTISGNSVFSAEFDSTFTIRPGKILSENDIIIRDGELNNFAPILALSRFIELEELRNIRFETLENTILIRDNQVVIPVMDIRSSAIDLSASGIHDFENLYDYRLKLKLSELLYKKARGPGSREFEEAEDESDTRTLFLRIYNEGSGPSVEMDREKTAQKIREDLKEEKAELKGILNEELGLFNRNKEVTRQRDRTEKEEEMFRFEFSDETDTLSVQSGVREKRRWKRNESKTESGKNKPAREFVIDE